MPAPRVAGKAQALRPLLGSPGPSRQRVTGLPFTDLASPSLCYGTTNLRCLPKQCFGGSVGPGGPPPAWCSSAGRSRALGPGRGAENTSPCKAFPLLGRPPTPPPDCPSWPPPASALGLPCCSPDAHRFIPVPQHLPDRTAQGSQGPASPRNLQSKQQRAGS